MNYINLEGNIIEYKHVNNNVSEIDIYKFVIEDVEYTIHVWNKTNINITEIRDVYSLPHRADIKQTKSIDLKEFEEVIRIYGLGSQMLTEAWERLSKKPIREFDIEDFFENFIKKMPEDTMVFMYMCQMWEGFNREDKQKEIE